MHRILYIEDNLEIGKWVKSELDKKGYSVDWKKDGTDAIDFAEEADLVILDVMLPGLDGFSVGKRLKRKRSDLPILILSARTSVEDKLEGLGFADDYLTKPFHPEELNARIEVLLRRSTDQKPKKRNIKHLTIYPDQRIENNETQEEIILTGKQYQILSYFLRHLNQILTKEQLYEGVWGENFIEGDKTLNVHIRYLREKIEKNPAKPEIIETIRGIGYRVKA
ncbi:response regulator transcription factor [Metabacillus arenae]|uniref:Response regulator transcription factor n=1 Tax=Metabacillus arenae TaxID=2771434 RepID=A0A926NH83_9BACI|nr:response regulator transcription factor [Metabacillus arenae]MBD1380518.1 response regulator transcription factor [Metabacillus arenae]